MGAIRDKGRAAFRDFNTDGVPASGAHEPVKSDIRLTLDTIDAANTALATVMATGKAYATKAAMNADLSPIAGTLAAVYNDPEDDLNGFYVKLGGTGSGSWANTNIGFPASFAGDLTTVIAELAGKQDRATLAAATPGGHLITAAGIDTETAVTAGATQAYNDIIARWWDNTNHRIWGGDGGIAFSNTRPFQWTMQNLHENIYWRAKAGVSDAVTKVTQNFAELLARQGQTLLSTASLGNDIGASDDAAWTLQYFTRVHDLTGNATALQIAKDLFASDVSTFADPNASGVGLLYTTDAGAVTLGHKRVSTLFDLWTAISACYLYQHGGTSTHLTFATHTYAWIKQYLMHPLGVLYIELDVDPTHSATYLTPIIGNPVGTPISPHYSDTFIAGAFAFMTLCKRLNDIAPNAQYLTDINNMMAAVLRTDTFLRPGDIFLSDRDGWTNGCGFTQFAAEVLPLTTINITLRDRVKQVLYNTALAIINLRSDAYYYNKGVTYGGGLYGSDWTGPEIGSNGMMSWFDTGNVGGGIALPEQIMTTGTNLQVVTAANMITGLTAATQYVPYTDLLPRLQKMLEKSVGQLGNTNIRGGLTLGGQLNVNAPIKRDNDLYIDISGGNSVIGLSGNDYILYNRTSDQFGVYIAGTPYLRVDTTKVQFGTGIYRDATFYMEIGTGPYINFDTGDYLSYDRSANKFQFGIGAHSYLDLDAVNLIYDGPITGTYLKADSLFYMNVAAGSAILAFDVNDALTYSRSANTLNTTIGGSLITSVTSAGLTVSNLTSNGSISASSGITGAGLTISGSSFLHNTQVTGTFSVSSTSILAATTINGGGTINGGIASGGIIFPSSDNAYVNGGPSNRWSVVYAGTGAINTSDEREKTWRGSLTADEMAAAKEIGASIGVFQFNDAVADKGLDHARLHTGVKAQQIGGIMQAHGLDPSRYGWFCYDEWDAVAEVVASPEDAIMAVAGRTAGNRFGIRYDELAMFLMAADYQERMAMEQRLAALEAA